MLRHKADRRTLAFVGTYFLLIAVVYSIDLPWWLAVPMCVALCVLSFLCAVITHNTVHSPVFKSRIANRVFQVVLSQTYGHPVSMFVPGHNLSHHKYLQTAKDRMRTDKMRFRWNLLNQLLFAAAVGGVIFKDNADYVKAMRIKRPRWVRQLILELGVYLAFLVTSLGLSFWMDGIVPVRFLMFVLIPHQYAVWGITGINFVQHDGCEPFHEYNHSRNFTGKLVNWFTFNNGFHGIHHMHPGLHWSLAPAAHAKELAPFVDPRLEQKSLLAYCWRAYIWPGKRVRFDGAPVVLGPKIPDEAWVPGAVDRGLGDASSDAEYGAVA